MKNLHFLENDYQCDDSDADIRKTKRKLNRIGFDVDSLNNMTIHYQFRLMDKEDIYKIIYNQENIIITYSMYVQGSNGDFIFFVSSAATNQIKNITYIDSSGLLVEFLNRNLRDHKDAIKVISGINSNNILTIIYNENGDPELKRIKINFVDYYDECVVLEDYKI